MIHIILKAIAVLSVGLFSGAAIYINAVEHPARMKCGTDAALREWRPSYQRATVMQASLAVLGFLCSFMVWYSERHIFFLIGAVLIGAVIPVTLLVIRPTNKQLLKPGIETNLQQAETLLKRWNRLHLIRSVLSLCSFITMLAGFLTT